MDRETIEKLIQEARALGVNNQIKEALYKYVSIMNEIGLLIENCTPEEKTSYEQHISTCQREFNDLRTTHEDIPFFTDDLASSRLDYLLDRSFTNISNFFSSGYNKVVDIFHSIASNPIVESATSTVASAAEYVGDAGILVMGGISNAVSDFIDGVETNSSHDASQHSQVTIVSDDPEAGISTEVAKEELKPENRDLERSDTDISQAGLPLTPSPVMVPGEVQPAEPVEPLEPVEEVKDVEVHPIQPDEESKQPVEKSEKPREQAEVKPEQTEQTEKVEQAEPVEPVEKA